MALRKPTGFLISALLLASALLSGCGGSSSSDNTTIPSTPTVFFAHSAAFKNNSSAGDPSSSSAQSLYTWGYNAFGQVGNDTLDNSTVANPVPGLPPVNRFATGGNHTLALAFANVSSVYGWGWNRQGQIGPDPAPADQAHSRVPIKIALGGEVREIAAGAAHSLAVVNVAGTTGQVKGWGLNSSGQLGDNGFADSSRPVFAVFSSTTRTTPLSGIGTVAAGSLHSLALTTPLPGRVYSWGLNDSGQLGRDTTTAGNAPVHRADLVQLSGADLTGVTKIAAGGSTSFALRGDGVWFWGYNPATRGTSATPVRIEIPGATGLAATIVDISAGWDHLLMLAADQAVWGWGFNAKSQLGDGTIVNSATPVRVLSASGQPLGGVTQIIAFGNHSLARSNGAWYGWGDNATGQLGNPISTSSIGYIMVPTLVNGL